MNKNELISEMSNKSGLSKKDSEASLNSLIEVIKETLKDGGKIQLVNFGTFETFKRSERNGINPKTQEPLTIKAATVPKFKAGKGFKDIVNQ